MKKIASSGTWTHELKLASPVWTAAGLPLIQKPKSLQWVHNWTQKNKETR